MTRSELMLIMALALFGAFCLGWLCRWIFGAMARAGTNNVATLHTMNTQIEQAEAAHSDLAAQLAETDSRLTARLREKEAELEATMDGLRQARQNALDWQAAYQDLEARQAATGSEQQG